MAKTTRTLTTKPSRLQSLTPHICMQLNPNPTAFTNWQRMFVPPGQVPAAPHGAKLLTNQIFKHVQASPGASCSRLCSTTASYSRFFSTTGAGPHSARPSARVWSTFPRSCGWLHWSRTVSGHLWPSPCEDHLAAASKARLILSALTQGRGPWTSLLEGGRVTLSQLEILASGKMRRPDLGFWA